MRSRERSLGFCSWILRIPSSCLSVGKSATLTPWTSTECFFWSQSGILPDRVAPSVDAALDRAFGVGGVGCQDKVSGRAASGTDDPAGLASRLQGLVDVPSRPRWGVVVVVRGPHRLPPVERVFLVVLSREFVFFFFFFRFAFECSRMLVAVCLGVWLRRERSGCSLDCWEQFIEQGNL